MFSRKTRILTSEKVTNDSDNHNSVEGVMYVDTETDFDFDGDSGIVDFYDIIRGRKNGNPNRPKKVTAASRRR